MKITLLIQRIANRAGGAERVVVDVANQLSRRGDKVEILAFEKTDGRPFYQLDSGIAYRNLGIMPKGGLTGAEKRAAAITRWCQNRSHLPGIGKIAWWLTYGKHVRRLRAHLEIYPSQLLIAFLPSAFTVTDELARELGVPFVLSCHNVPQEDFENPERWDQNPEDKKRRTEAMRRADALTVILPDFLNWFPEKIRPKVHVIRNFVTGPTCSYPPVLERTKRVLAVGRYTDTKDHAVLIRAWKKIAAEFPDWSVEIYGEGPLESVLAALIGELGLESSVALRPPSEHIMDLYGNSQIFCIPSKFEGFGLVTAEAMSCGTPAVGFLSCPGTNRLIVDGQTGILVDCSEENKAEALAENLAKLIHDEALRSRYAVQSLSEGRNYLVEHRIKDWFCLIDSLRSGQTAETRSSDA